MKLVGHSISDSNGTIVAIDAAACDLLERNRRELVGMSYLELTHPADRKRNAALVSRLPSEAAPIQIRKRYLTPGNGAVEVDVEISRFTAGADSGRLVGSLYRVAPDDARHTPDLLWRAAQRLAHSNAVRRDLLGSDMFADYALAIMLQLYLDEAEGRASDTTTVAALVDLPASTAKRWFRALEGKGLIDLMPGANIVQLTSMGARKLSQLLAIDMDQ